MGTSGMTGGMSSQKGRPGWVIPAIIVVGGLVAGLAWTVWKAASEPIPPTEHVIITSEAPSQSDGETEEDAKTAALAEVGSSTEVDSIEQDLEATDFTGLDAEMGMMEQEMGQ